MSDLTPERRAHLRRDAERSTMAVQPAGVRVPPLDVLALLDRADEADRLEQHVRWLWSWVPTPADVRASIEGDDPDLAELLARVLEGDDQ